MKLLRNTVIRAGLEALYFSGAHYLLRPIFAGVGVIFMLHHVRPRRDDAFQPNHHLEVEPEFLRATLAHLRSLDIDIVTMDEVHQRLQARDFARRFACFTLDDGYRDNRDFALPVMREFDAPFTIYVTSDFAEGTGRLWWVALERVIARASAIEVPISGVKTCLDASTPSAKCAAFDRLHDWLRELPTEHDMQREISALCARHEVDETTIARELCMSWEELQAFANDPLVTIGAHTVTHGKLARQSEESASLELATGRARIEAALQRPVLHLAYPYGDRLAAGPREFRLAQTAGFKTAVTTRPGMIFPESAGHMTALQRVSLNGISRVVQRTCEAMKEAGITDPTDIAKVRALGVIDLPTIQKKLNLHYSLSLDLFGSEVSTNAANAFNAGIKGRYKETQIDDDHQLKSATYPVLKLVDGVIKRVDEPALTALNMRLRDDYTQDCVKGMLRWNKVISTAGYQFKLTLPDVAFHRQIGEFKAIHATPDGILIDDATWNARKGEWLPSTADGDFIASLMKPVTEAGEYASWISPPKVGIDNKPGDFEYVKIET